MNVMSGRLLFPLLVTVLAVVTVMGGVALAAPAEEVSFYVA